MLGFKRVVLKPTGDAMLGLHVVLRLWFWLVILGYADKQELICEWYLGSPVGLGHLARGRDGVCEDFSIVWNPGTADAF